MSYVTRSGRRTKKVNYADIQRRTDSSRSTTPILTLPPLTTQDSDKENEESEIEILNPKKKQKLSTSIPPSSKRRRRRRCNKSICSDMHHHDDHQMDLTSNNSNSRNVPPPLQPISSSIIIPPLPTFTSPSNRKKRKRKSSKQEVSSDSSSSDEIQILPTKKRKLTPLKPTKKSPRKKKAKPEKRRARKRTLSQKTRERVARAKSQRLFMINAKVINEYEREYAVLGSTGNVYTITIGTLHNCTCPDFAKGNLCKHVMFILLKVLRVQSNSEYVYQKALLTSELDDVFAAAPQTLFGSVLANATVRNQYKASMGDDDGDIEVKTVERKALDGGDCPVCMEEFKGNEATTYCRAQCGNNVHVECFNEWRGNAERSGEELCCMFCRAKWVDGEEDGVRKKKKKGSRSGGFNEGYMNLAEEQGISRQRDTSSYYSSGWSGYRRRSYGSSRYRRWGRNYW